MDQPSCMGVMQCLGNCGNPCRILVAQSSLCIPCRQVVALMNFRDHETQSPSFGASHVHECRTMLGWSRFGEDSCFTEKRLNNPRHVGDSFRIWHLDGNRAIQIIVVCKIRPVQTRLATISMDDPVSPPNLGRISVRRAAKLSSGGCGSLWFLRGLSSLIPMCHPNRQQEDTSLRCPRWVLRLIHYSIPDYERSHS